mgnify:CR=1 FL=1
MHYQSKLPSFSVFAVVAKPVTVVTTTLVPPTTTEVVQTTATMAVKTVTTPKKGVLGFELLSAIAALSALALLSRGYK